jgi:hypothetical protein
MRKVKNKFKFKNKVSWLSKLRKKFHELYVFEEVVVGKISINIESYKYLYRHLVKINRCFNGHLFITLNKTEYKGAYGYTAVINLKVIK